MKYFNFKILSVFLLHYSRRVKKNQSNFSTSRNSHLPRATPITVTLATPGFGRRRTESSSSQGHCWIPLWRVEGRPCSPNYKSLDVEFPRKWHCQSPWRKSLTAAVFSLNYSTTLEGFLPSSYPEPNHYPPVLGAHNFKTLWAISSEIKSLNSLSIEERWLFNLLEGS